MTAPLFSLQEKMDLLRTLWPPKLVKKRQEGDTKSKRVRPSDDFTCSYCKALVFDPVVDKCGHLFCRQCPESSIKKIKECPIDRIPLSVDADVRDDLRACRQIGNLYCKCKKVGCPWEGRINDLAEHYESCGYNDDGSLDSQSWTILSKTYSSDMLSDTSSDDNHISDEALPENCLSSRDLDLSSLNVPNPQETDDTGNITPNTGDKPLHTGNITPNTGDKPLHTGNITPNTSDNTPKAGKGEGNGKKEEYSFWAKVAIGVVAAVVVTVVAVAVCNYFGCGWASSAVSGAGKAIGWVSSFFW